MGTPVSTILVFPSLSLNGDEDFPGPVGLSPSRDNGSSELIDSQCEVNDNRGSVTVNTPKEPKSKVLSEKVGSRRSGTPRPTLPFFLHITLRHLCRDITRGDTIGRKIVKDKYRSRDLSMDLLCIPYKKLG